MSLPPLSNTTKEPVFQFFSLEETSKEPSPLNLPELEFESQFSRQNIISQRVHATFACLTEIGKNPISSQNALTSQQSLLSQQTLERKRFETSIQGFNQANLQMQCFYKFEDELKSSVPQTELPVIPNLLFPNALTDSITLCRQSNVEQSMAVAKLLGTAIETMDMVVEKAITAIISLPHFKPAVKEATLTAAIPNPFVRETVKILAPVAKNMIEAESTKFLQTHPHLQEKMKKAVKWTEQTIHKVREFILKKPLALSHELHSQFNILEEESFAFTSHANRIVIHFALGAPTKKIIKPLFTRSKTVERAVSYPISPTKVRQSYLYFPKTEPVSSKINRLALNELHFPTVIELKKQPIQELHQIWSTNNKTLAGFIDQNTIPRFGFHGTDEIGFKGIKFSQRSMSVDQPFIWIAGYRYNLDAITALADINAIIIKASYYAKKGGGFFVIDTKNSFSSGRPIYYPKEYVPSALKEDSKAEAYFHHLMFRKQHKDLNYTNSKSIPPNLSFPINSSYMVNADELLIHFNSHTYSSVVRGSFLLSKTLYSADSMQFLRKQDVIKAFLASRFKLQEITLEAFEHLGLTQNLKPGSWHRYHLVGTELFKKIDTVTTLSATKAIQLIKAFEKQHIEILERLLNNQTIQFTHLPKETLYYYLYLKEKQIKHLL